MSDKLTRSINFGRVTWHSQNSVILYNSKHER